MALSIYIYIYNLYFDDLFNLTDRFPRRIARTNGTHIKIHVHRRRNDLESGKHEATVEQGGKIDDLWLSRWNGFASGTQTDIRGYRISAKQIKYSTERICKNYSRCSRLVALDKLFRTFHFYFCLQIRNVAMEKIRQHYHVTQPDVNRFMDLNNNNDEPYSMVEQEMSSVISIQTKNDFELKETYYFNVRPQKASLYMSNRARLWTCILKTLLLLQDNLPNSHFIRIIPPIPNKNSEQIEPMDLSCDVKNKNSKAANKTRYNKVHIIFEV